MNEPLYVEASALLRGHLTGIGRFVCRLLMELVEHGPVRLTAAVDAEAAAKWNMPALLCGRDLLLDKSNLPAATDLRAWVDHLWTMPTEPHNPAKARQAAALFPYLRPAVRRFRREIGVVYDFTPLLQPAHHDEQTRREFAASFRALRLCDAVVAISEATKRDAGFLTDVDPNRVAVHYPGPSQCVHAHAHSAPVKRRDDLILVVATLEPRKNARFVLDWFLNSPAVPANMRLCWVGPPGWLPALGEKPPASDRITFPGAVSDAELCRLYQEATFTIYPSLYEGFGFPVLDSLMHGAPVAASYNSSLMEFNTPGVFYFDPGDAGTLDDACGELLAARRALHIDRAELERRFSWGALAQAVLRHARGEGLACAS